MWSVVWQQWWTSVWQKVRVRVHGNWGKSATHLVFSLSKVILICRIDHALMKLIGSSQVGVVSLADYLIFVTSHKWNFDNAYNAAIKVYFMINRPRLRTLKSRPSRSPQKVGLKTKSSNIVYCTNCRKTLTHAKIFAHRYTGYHLILNLPKYVS